MGITLAPMSTCSYTDLLSGRVTSFREANLRSEKYKDGPNGLKNAVCVRTNDGKCQSWSRQRLNIRTREYVNRLAWNRA